MNYKDRIKFGGILLLVNIAITVVLMFALKRHGLIGFEDMAFFVGIGNIVIGITVKGGRFFGKEPMSFFKFKRFIPESRALSAEEKVEHKIHDIAVGWVFIFCGIIWSVVAGGTYMILGA